MYVLLSPQHPFATFARKYHVIGLIRSRRHVAVCQPYQLTDPLSSLELKDIRLKDFSPEGKKELESRDESGKDFCSMKLS